MDDAIFVTDVNRIAIDGGSSLECGSERFGVGIINRSITPDKLTGNSLETK